MLPYLLLGGGFAFAAVVQPGPLQAFLLSRAVAAGWRRTLPAALSPVLSDGPIALLVLLVLGRLPETGQNVLRVAGGVLLLYLAWAALRPLRPSAESGAPAPDSAPRTLLQAATVNLLNPNPYLGWALVLGPAAAKAWHERPAFAVALVAAFYGVIVAGQALFIVAASGARLLKPGARRALVAASAAVLAVLGAWQLAAGTRALLAGPGGAPALAAVDRGPAPASTGADARAAVEACVAKLPVGVQVAAAVVRGGDAAFHGAERTKEGVRAVANRGAVFQIGSITKVFTATLLAQQVTTGALRLEDPVAGRLPFRLAASGRDGVEMTLVQLASHTSGIAHHQPRGLASHAWLHFHPRQPWRDWDRARFQKYLERDLELASVPGTRYLYSNVGMSLLGLVLTERTGRPYETLLREGIFGPLGMTSSTTDPLLVRGRVVPGRTLGGAPYPNQFMAALTPCGGLYTTAEDLARFARAEIARADPAVALSQKPVFAIADGEAVALGWHLYDLAPGLRVLNHNGGIGGYTSSVYVDPPNGRAAVVLSNVMNEGEAGESIRALARTLLRQPNP